MRGCSGPTEAVTTRSTSADNASRSSGQVKRDTTAAVQALPFSRDVSTDRGLPSRVTSKSLSVFFAMRPIGTTRALLPSSSGMRRSSGAYARLGLSGTTRSNETRRLPLCSSCRRALSTLRRIQERRSSHAIAKASPKASSASSATGSGAAPGFSGAADPVRTKHRVIRDSLGMGRSIPRSEPPALTMTDRHYPPSRATGCYRALHNRGCSWGLNPPASSRDLAM